MQKWVVYEYTESKHRFYTYRSPLLDPRVKQTLTLIGYANTREEAVELVWQGRPKPQA